MARVALAVASVVAASGMARADGMRRIRVETTPPKAHVYLEDVETGLKCEATPCEFEAPLGEDTLLIQLEHFKPLIEAIDVKRGRGKPQLFKFELEAAVGTIVVDDTRAKGASIQIDGKDRGKAPLRVHVEPGGHQVILKLGRKTLFEDFVDVDAGAEQAIELAVSNESGDKPQPSEASRERGDDHGDETDGQEGGKAANAKHDDSDGELHKPVEVGERSRFLTIQLLVDVGWRRFHYDDAVPTLPANESEDGVVMAGPAIELWPAEALHAELLRPLSLFVRGQYKLNALDVKDGRTGEVVGQTSWASYEASVRYRWGSSTYAVEGSSGYVRDRVVYDTGSSTGMKLPAGDYQSIRFGARALARTGAFEPYVAAETRVVMSGGDLQTRFTNASATGLRGALGVTATAGSMCARAEVAYLKYSWSYPTDVNTQASGASDKLFGISISFGYQY
jgi:hypothetical protein